jgi:hypothetical protein
MLICARSWMHGFSENPNGNLELIIYVVYRTYNQCFSLTCVCGVQFFAYTSALKSD